MKRFLAVLAALCFVLPLLIQARVVTETEAFTVAEKLISMENQMVHLRLSKELVFFKSLEPLLYKEEMIGYLVNLEPRGFMILAAMTEDDPEKFVCFSGNFDEVKDNPFLVEVIDRLLYDKVQLNYCLNPALAQEYCRFAEAADVHQIYKNESKWIALLSSEEMPSDSNGYSVGPLIQSQLGQGDPWNMFTPMMSGKHFAAGCSAVAQAQVIGYWLWPERGTGSNSYSWNGTTLYANFDHTYSWWYDTHASGGGHTPTCFHSMFARLISDVGISINMDYGNTKNGSPDLTKSSAALNANNSLQTFFKYSPLIKTVWRKDYPSWDDWFNLMTVDLDSSHGGAQKGVNIVSWPVLLSINNSSADKHHAVVVDGFRYSPSNQVHLNMGWDGAYDNWYSMNNIYANGTTYGDATQDSAVIGIRPRSEIPTVKISGPKDGQYVIGQNVHVSVTTGDDYDAIDSVEFYIDGTLKTKKGLDSSNYASYSWDSMTANNGEHKIKVIAYDDEGQASLPAEIRVNVCNVIVNLTATRKIESAWMVKRHYADLSWTSIQPASYWVSAGDFIIWKLEILRKESNGDYRVIKTWEIPTGSGVRESMYTDKYLEKNKTYTYQIKVYDGGGLCGKSMETTI